MADVMITQVFKNPPFALHLSQPAGAQGLAALTWTAYIQDYYVGTLYVDPKSGSLDLHPARSTTIGDSILDALSDSEESDMLSDALCDYARAAGWDI